MILDMYLEPVDGDLDVTAIQAFLERLPLSVRDAKKPTTFMVADNEDTLAEAVAAREHNDRGFPTSILLIDVHPQRIDIAYRTTVPETARTFVVWLRDRYAVRIRDEDYGDITAHLDPDLDVLFGARAPRTFPLGATLDHGRYELLEVLYGGPDRGLYRAHDREDGGAMLVTLGPPQRDAHELVRRRLAFDVPRIARLRHIGPLETDGGRYDGLVEDEPRGRRSSKLDEPWSLERTIAIGLAVADVLRSLHAQGTCLGGLRPELVYVDGDSLVGIAPRCEPFLVATEKRSGVAPCFAAYYFSPEQLAQPGVTTPADDVFALATMMAKWHTGEHPFEGDYGANAIAIATHQRRPWCGEPELETLIDRALVPGPSRATLDALCECLRELASD